MTGNNSIDKYIEGFPASTRAILEKLRKTIQVAAPGAEQTINYGIPTFTLKGNLVHFGAYKNHIGFYPAPSGIEAFKKELSKYEGAKGSIKFPIDKPLPFGLISKIVKFRVKENLQKDSIKAKKNLKVYPLGHSYYKSGDCPTCPVCETQHKPEIGFLSTLSAPARRAMESAGITRLPQVAKLTKQELLKLHGIGPASVPLIQAALQKAGLSFKKTGTKDQPE